MQLERQWTVWQFINIYIVEHKHELINTMYQTIYWLLMLNRQPCKDLFIRHFGRDAPPSARRAHICRLIGLVRHVGIKTWNLTASYSEGRVQTWLKRYMISCYSTLNLPFMNAVKIWQQNAKITSTATDEHTTRY